MDEVGKDLLANGSVYYRTTAALESIRVRQRRELALAAFLVGLPAGMWLGARAGLATVANVLLVICYAIYIWVFLVRDRREWALRREIARTTHSIATARGRFLRKALSDEDFQNLAQVTMVAEEEAVRQSRQLAEFYKTAPSRLERRVLELMRRDSDFLLGIAEWSWDDMSGGLSLREPE